MFALLLALGVLTILSLKSQAHLDHARPEPPRPIKTRVVARERTKRKAPEPQPEPIPSPVEAEPAEENPIPLPGKTRFQRRLVAGDQFHQIAEELKSPGADRAALGARAIELSLYRLHADENLPRASARALAAVCESLAACRLGRLQLANPSSTEDPLGNDLHLRVWTLDGRFPEAEIRRAQKTIEHLEKVVGFQVASGYDVLATPKRGDEALLFQGGYSWAAGMYFIEDGYCAIKSRLAPWFRPECLEHELIHAFCHQYRKNFFSSRFICEGLAEYLRFYEPGDPGLGVPPIRMKHQLACLLAIIDRFNSRGFSLAVLDPGLLLELKPRRFYALRQFSYLVALAAMTYIGGGPIEKAFRQGTDRPIADAIRAIQWDDLLLFIERYGATGSPDRAVVVMDPAGPSSTPSGDVEREDWRSALEDLGIAPARGATLAPADFTYLPRERVGDEDQVAALLRRDLSERESLRIFTDCGQDMSGGFELNQRSRVLVPPFTPQALWAPGRWGFVDLLHRVFREHSPPTEVPLLGIFPDPAAVDPQAPLNKDFAPLEIARWLKKQKGTFNLLLLVASRDAEARAQVSAGESPPRDEGEMRPRLEALYRDQFQPVRGWIRSALVIDLARGQGDALPLALGLAALEGFQGDFASWDPQAAR
jgi:hypothetical protein